MRFRYDDACGRYTVPYTGDDIEKLFEASRNIGVFEATWNAAPGQLLPVITKNSPLKAQLMKWAFFPWWEKNWVKPQRRPQINITAEKGLVSYAKKEFENTRCLVVAQGYYEWRKFMMDGKE